MKLLALDTSTQAFSVALFDSDACLSEHQLAPRLHAKLLLPTIEKLLAEAEMSLSQLDGIAFGRGPGAFTGVRIAAAAVQGLALGADIGVAPISSLAIVAQQALTQYQGDDAAALAAFDARMDEVYAGYFKLEAGVAQLLGDEQVGKPDTLQLPMLASDTILAVSDGWKTYPEALASQFQGSIMRVDYADLLPDARHMLALAQYHVANRGWLPAEKAEPVYLRNNVAIAKDKSL